MILVIDGTGISCEIALRWMSLADDKSTMVQIMAWCRQAASHLPDQMLTNVFVTNGVTDPQ